MSNDKNDAFLLDSHAVNRVGLLLGMADVLSRVSFCGVPANPYNEFTS